MPLPPVQGGLVDPCWVQVVGRMGIKALVHALRVEVVPQGLCWIMAGCAGALPSSVNHTPDARHTRSVGCVGLCGGVGYIAFCWLPRPCAAFCGAGQSPLEFASGSAAPTALVAVRPSHGFCLVAGCGDIGLSLITDHMMYKSIAALCSCPVGCAVLHLETPLASWVIVSLHDSLRFWVW